ncbi:hypothetical protein [Rhizobium leguminosarum]|uniref:hypothetical protein n=1 Tax=Rhizobium leguminosarum TaxID=384 RepID=UPI0021BBD1C9|nr:hypothetical protein [Rhizobium leguminosarum]
MKIRPEILDHWPEVRARLPAGFDLEATARLRGAFTRVREIKNAETLLRLALAYGGLGMSLCETCAWAEAGGIARLSDPSLLERLCKAAPWLGDIVAALIAEQTKVPAGRFAAIVCVCSMERRSAIRALTARHGGCMSATTWQRLRSISLS